MALSLSRGVFRTDTPVKIESFASVAGAKEGEGPLGEYFDEIVEDSHFGQPTWEKAESRFQLEAVSLAVRKAGLVKEDIDVICSGDLIDQCIGSTYGLKELSIPYLGLYGACSTMDGSRYIVTLFDSGEAVPFSALIRRSEDSDFTVDVYGFGSGHTFRQGRTCRSRRLHRKNNRHGHQRYQ